MILLLLLAKLWGGSQAYNHDNQIQVQPVVWAQEGLCAFLSCNFKYRKNSRINSPTHVYWYRVLGNQYYNRDNIVATNTQTKKVSPNTKGRFQLVGNPEDGNCSLLISDVWKSDQGRYCFRVEHGQSVHYSYIESMVSLEVTDQTQPNVYILEPLWPNRLGTIICVFNATFDWCLAPSFSWTGPVLSTSRPQVSNHRFSALKIAPRPQDQGTDLTCSVRFYPWEVRVQKTLRLDVAYAPKDLVIRVSQVKGTAPMSHSEASTSFYLQAQKGSYLQLLCEASSHPPASLSWSLGDRVLACSNLKDPQALALELSSVLVGDTGSYTCLAENAIGQRMHVVHLEVQYPPEDMSVMVSVENRTVLQTLQKSNTLEVLQGQSLQLRCVTHSSPPAILSWSRGSLLLNPAQPTEPGLLLLPQIRPDQEGEFTCQAQNQLGSQKVSVTIRVYSSPQLLGLHCSWKALALHCSYLAHEQPVPTLRSWLGSKLLPENSSEASVQINTQGLWANSSLRLLREFNTGITLSCQAWNMHGTENGSVLLLPGNLLIPPPMTPPRNGEFLLADEKVTLRGAFPNGVLVGTGIAGLLCLAVILILVIFLRRTGKQTKQLSCGSTNLEYINIFPRSGSHKESKAEAKPQEEHYTMSYAEATPQAQASQDQEDDVQYSHLHFPSRRLRVLQSPIDSQEEYVEIRFH